MRVPVATWVRIIPAYAGSTGFLAVVHSPRADHPRIRGEHNTHTLIGASNPGSSPHTRGAQVGGRPGIPVKGIIPAYAGSTTPHPGSPSRSTDHPRIRGEHGDQWGQDRVRVGSSPHTRGAQECEYLGQHVRGIIPAYAGSTTPPTPESSPTTDHPRIRGEHGSTAKMSGLRVGSSPHTRGAQHSQDAPVDVERIIPAYAGSTSCRRARVGGTRDHPRIRGEHRDAVAECERGHRIIPAYAGSTMCGRRTAGTSGDHPRIRGEHGLCDIGPAATPGSSPHTRGAPEDRRRSGRRPRIIPAYAGSTLNSTGDIRFATDHPRIRGEHAHTAEKTTILAGSSPHTRGARDDAPQERTGCGIIPAYAGSTYRR